MEIKKLKDSAATLLVIIALSNRFGRKLLYKKHKRIQNRRNQLYRLDREWHRNPDERDRIEAEMEEVRQDIRRMEVGRCK